MRYFTFLKNDFNYYYGEETEYTKLLNKFCWTMAEYLNDENITSYKEARRYIAFELLALLTTEDINTILKEYYNQIIFKKEGLNYLCMLLIDIMRFLYLEDDEER